MLNLKLRILFMVFLTFLLFLYWDIKPKINKFFDLQTLSKKLQNDFVENRPSNRALPQKEERSSEEILEEYLTIVTDHGYEIFEVSNFKSEKTETAFELTFSGDFSHLETMFKKMFERFLGMDMTEFSLSIDEKGVILMHIQCVISHFKRI
jgi:hypothetical protein